MLAVVFGLITLMRMPHFLRSPTGRRSLVLTKMARPGRSAILVARSLLSTEVGRTSLASLPCRGVSRTNCVGRRQCTDLIRSNAHSRSASGSPRLAWPDRSLLKCAQSRRARGDERAGRVLGTGQQILRRATAQMVNEQGGVEIDGEKYQIEIVSIDDKNDPKLAVSGAERLIYPG